MPQRVVQILNRQGLHMRPAGEFVKIARRFASAVTVSVGERKADGKSVMDMLELAGEALHGAALTIAADGADAEACLDALAELVQAKFHEE